MDNEVTMQIAFGPSATGAEQSATAAEELNRQAEGLKTMVARFKVS